MSFSEMIEGYVDKVYAYAARRTFTEEEARDLSQDILLTALKAFPCLRDESRFEPWLWKIADNVTKSFSRRQSRLRAIYSYDFTEDFESACEEDDTEDIENEYAQLREKIAMLSAKYREIIILFYYDGLSTKSISEKLNIPEGTVTWRLSEARRKIKKEFSNMETSALYPQKLCLDITGSGNYDGKTIPFPSAFINDAISQNILVLCYDEAKNTEDLSRLCGIPAYYIEERLQNLISRCAIIEESKGKYRTDFIIWQDKHGKYCEENSEKLLLPVSERILKALNALADEAYAIGHYKAEKSRDELFYLYGILGIYDISKKYINAPCPEIHENYDGNRWRYVGSIESGAYRRSSIGRQICSNLGSRGRYNHLSFGRINGFAFRPMMYDNYINVCEDILISGESEDRDSVSLAIRDGYIIRREDGRFFVTVPAFTKEEKAKFDELAERHLSPIMCEFSEIVRKFASGYKKLFPVHLADDVQRANRDMFTALLCDLFRFAQRDGKIKMPPDGALCDVMIQFK